MGESVVYVPQHGPREDGVVTSHSADRSLVFVRYGGEHAPSKATRVIDLEERARRTAD